MLMMKKAQALVETILWLAVVIAMICIVLPIAAMIALAGMLLRVFGIEFVSDLAIKLTNMIIAFVKFVTRRIRVRTREIESLRAQLQ